MRASKIEEHEMHHMKIACSTGIRSTRPLVEACHIIKGLGFRNVDPLAMEQWHIKPSRLAQDSQREADQVAELLDRFGLRCPAINLGFVHNFSICSDQEHETNLEVARGARHLASSLGTEVVTVSPGSAGGAGRVELMPQLAARLRQLVEILAEGGQVAAVETHAGSLVVWPDAARWLLEACPGLRLTYDPSHYIHEQVPVEETADLIEHAAHVHLRNARIGWFQETMEKGSLDISWVTQKLRERGYLGAVSIEYIEDCGALREGYDIDAQVRQLRDLLVNQGLTL